MKEKKNYIVKYSKGCKKVGTYTVQIIGKGTYTGTVKKQFVILPPKAQIMNIYAKTAAATVVVKRQTSQTSGYQLRYATNSKLKNAKTITVKGNKNNTIFLNGLRAGTTYYMQTRTYMTVKGKKILFQMVFYRPLHNKQRDKQYPPKCNPYTYTNAYIHTGSYTHTDSQS